MPEKRYSDLYGKQPPYGAQPPYGQPMYQPQPPGRAPHRPQQQPVMVPIWGGEPEQRPWYLQTWFIVLLSMFWLPLPVSIVLMIKQADYDKKMAGHYKTIRDAEAYWAYVKEDSARIYREASEKSDALLRDSRKKARDAEKQANDKLIKTDRDCKALRIKLERETKELIEQRDLLRGERDMLRDQVSLLETRQILMELPEDN